MGKRIKELVMPVGRPSDINEERCAKILSAIRNNVPYELACHKGQICEKTLYTWLNRGYDDIAAGKDTINARFVWNVRTAEVLKVEEHLGAIESQSERWQARAWILQRRYPRIYGDHADLYEELKKRIMQLEQDANIDEHKA